MKPSHSRRSQLYPFLAVAAWLCVALSARADIVVPGANGSDGVFDPTNATTIIDLSLAPTGVWSGPNASPGNGVYDPEKWAIVFRYTSVNIPAGVTVRFANHPANPPVVWLVTGNVTISGVLHLSGEKGGVGIKPGSPGPGGFRGSLARGEAGPEHSAGFGVGGGGLSLGGGSYATRTHLEAGPTYGSSTLIPLIGGSGGAGYYGGAGGGAVAIIASKTIQTDGAILADGGEGNDLRNSNYGSGGAVRLVGETVRGAGRVQATGGIYGGNGRIRIESLLPFAGMRVVPVGSYAALTQEVKLWREASSPRVVIQSVGPAAAPADPRGGQVADVEVPFGTGTHTVTVAAFNLPATAQVMLRATPFSGPHREYLCSKVSGTDAQSLWQAEVPMAVGAVSFQVRATSE